MSKYINEIIKDVRSNPETWRRYGNDGLEKDNIKIHQCGNGSKYFIFWMTSVVEVTINGKDTWGKTSWRDKYRIEEIVLWWMRNASLVLMSA